MLLALDLSTKSTGWALFQIKSKELLDYGFLKPKVKRLYAMRYPQGSLMKMDSIAVQVCELLDKVPAKSIAIEEITGKGRKTGRISQKVLDGLHFIVLDRIRDRIKDIIYKDPGGKTGWRKDLNLFLSENDKALNKQRRKWNAKLPKGTKKRPIIKYKHLACRFSNKTYGTTFDFDQRETDSDMADAICLGHAILLTSD